MEYEKEEFVDIYSKENIKSNVKGLFNKETPNNVKNIVISLSKKIGGIIRNWKGLGVFMNNDAIHDKAYKWSSNVYQAQAVLNNPLLPPDVRQSYKRSIFTKDGMPISSVALPTDYNIGERAAITPMYITLTFAVLILLKTAGITIFSSLSTGMFSGLFSLMNIGVLVGTGLMFLVLPKFLSGNIKSRFSNVVKYGFYILLAAVFVSIPTTNWLYNTLLFTLPGIGIIYLSYSADLKRALRLSNQYNKHPSTLNEKVVKEEYANNPQIIQAKAVLADKTPFVKVGDASGRFQHYGSDTAPDTGAPIGFTLKDLTHILIFGMTRSGKTRKIRHLLIQLTRGMLSMGKKIGLFVIDGKGDLAKEVKRILDMVFTPENVKNVNIIDGIKPETVVAIIKQANGDAGTSEGNANKIFTDSGYSILYFSLLLRIKFLEIKDKLVLNGEDVNGSFNYVRTLGTRIVALGNLDKDKNLVSHEIIELLKLHPNFETDYAIIEIVKAVEEAQLPANQETMMSFLINFRNSFTKMTQNPIFGQWLNCETSDLEITDVYKGKKYGVALPYERYGDAGLIFTKLLKAKVLNYGAQRESDWQDDKSETELLLVCDEAQDLISSEDIDAAIKGDGRGIKLLYATQTIQNFRDKLGNNARVLAFLSAFANTITFKVDDKDTIDFISSLLGKIKAIFSMTKSGNPIDMIKTSANFMKQPEFNPLHPEAHALKFSGDTDITGSDFIKDTEDDKKKYNNILVEYGFNQNNPYTDLLTYDDINQLQTFETAIVRVRRGGLTRHDVARAKGLSVEEFNEAVKQIEIDFTEKLNLKKAA